MFGVGEITQIFLCAPVIAVLYINTGNPNICDAQSLSHAINTGSFDIRIERTLSCNTGL
jgi:hypothetical protein